MEKKEEKKVEVKKDFSSYPVFINTTKKTYIFFGIIFLIAIILFFCFFYQNEARKDGLERAATSIYLNR